MNIRMGLPALLAALALSGCGVGIITKSSGWCYNSGCDSGAAADTRDPSQIGTDKATTRAIRKKLERDPTLEPFNLSVDTHTGVVTLRGYVDNVDQRKAAEKAARSAGPVTKVRNLVGVRQ